MCGKDYEKLRTLIRCTTGSIDEVACVGATNLSEVVHHVDAWCGVRADYRSHTLGCGAVCSMSTK